MFLVPWNWNCWRFRGRIWRQWSSTVVVGLPSLHHFWYYVIKRLHNPCTSWWGLISKCNNLSTVRLTVNLMDSSNYLHHPVQTSCYASKVQNFESRRAFRSSATKLSMNRKSRWTDLGCRKRQSEIQRMEQKEGEEKEDFIPGAPALARRLEAIFKRFECRRLEIFEFLPPSNHHFENTKLSLSNGISQSIIRQNQRYRYSTTAPQ